MTKSTLTKRRLQAIGLVAASAATIGVVGSSGFVKAADHLDAPGLTSPSARPDADINDVYAFNSDKAGRSVLVMTTGPGAGAIAPKTYATNVAYKINVDNTGDAVADLAYVVRYGAVKGTKDLPKQSFTVSMVTGADAATGTKGKAIAAGSTNLPEAKIKGGGRAWSGLRSDPFFFDLDAFRQVVLKQDRGRKSFCDTNGAGVDFFAALNTNAIILDVPNATIGGKIGVWAQTIDASGTVIDQMGRPAINTVFNSGEDKNVFNATAALVCNKTFTPQPASVRTRPFMPSAWPVSYACLRPPSTATRVRPMRPARSRPLWPPTASSGNAGRST